MIPESAARRHAKDMPLKLIALTDEWARELHICVRALDELPIFAKELVALLVQDAVISGSA